MCAFVETPAPVTKSVWFAACILCASIRTLLMARRRFGSLAALVSRAVGIEEDDQERRQGGAAAE
jgi:hypothetical protein